MERNICLQNFCSVLLDSCSYDRVLRFLYCGLCFQGLPSVHFKGFPSGYQMLGEGGFMLKFTMNGNDSVDSNVDCWVWFKCLFFFIAFQRSYLMHGHPV